MSFARKVAVAIDLNDPHAEIFKAMKQLDFLNNSEVHFVTVNMTTTYAIGLGESSIVYPLVDDQKKIQESTVAGLGKLSGTFLGHDFKGKIITECLFSDDPKRKFCEFIAEKNIDTIIVAAREKRGIFESSFTQYVNKHSHANMIILKHKV
jgi:nucleotide-binding universal stress UspA family protein